MNILNEYQDTVLKQLLKCKMWINLNMPLTVNKWLMNCNLETMAVPRPSLILMIFFILQDVLWDLQGSHTWNLLNKKHSGFFGWHRCMVTRMYKKSLRTYPHV